MSVPQLLRNRYKFQGKEGEQGGTGSFYNYKISLENVIFEDEQNNEYILNESQTEDDREQLR